MNKTVLTSFTILCLLSTVFLMECKVSVKAVPELCVHNVDAGLNYATIQEAIDANETLDGHTIFVEVGTYYEHVVVNKSLSLIGQNASTTIIDGNGTAIVVHVTANNVNISGFIIRNSGEDGYSDGGIWLDHSSGNNISNNVMTNNEYGIYLRHSNGNILAFNKVSSSYNVGIELWYSSNNTLTANNVSNNEHGIFLQASSNNSLMGNIISSNKYYGIELNGSSNNTLSYNIASNNKYNFCDYGPFSKNYDNFVDITNTVDGKPIYYLIGVSDAIYDAETKAGIFYLINCNNVTVKDVTLTQNVYGFNLWNTRKSRIEGVTASNNAEGIHLHYSDDNIIVGNNLSNNFRAGIMLYYSNNNTVKNNRIADNILGLELVDSRWNAIYHNNFIDNGAFCDGRNFWDDGYPSGGNHWSDYSSVDLYSGCYQNETGHDWIGDTPYVIDENNQDNYPLMDPYAPEKQETRVAYRNLLERYNQILSDFNISNSTYHTLLSNFSELQGNYTSHQISYNSLQGLYDSLNSTYSNLVGELNNIRNLMYIFIATTVILIATTIYLAIRKPKIKP